MLETWNDAAGGIASTMASGTEGTVAWLISVALSPMGLALIGCAIVVALWKARG